MDFSSLIGLASDLLMLQVGDVAFSVPNSLVVTLERVLGNETIGKVELSFWAICPPSFQS